MARVLPSQVRVFIATAFPWVEDAEKRRNTAVGRSYLSKLAALVELVGQIPQELFVLDNTDYVGLLAALSECRSVIAEWQGYDQRGGAPVLNPGFDSGTLPGVVFVLFSEPAVVPHGRPG